MRHGRPRAHSEQSRKSLSSGRGRHSVEAVGTQMPISAPARMGGLLLNLVRVAGGEGGMLVIVEVA